MTALATAEEVAAYSKGSIAADDPRLEPMLDGVSASIRRYCGWHITPVETVTNQKFDGTGNYEFQIPTLKLLAVTALETPTYTYDPDTLEWSEDGTIRSRHRRFLDQFRSITASYQHGYEDAEDLKQVVLAVVTRALSSPSGATREQAGALSIEWARTSASGAGGIALLENERRIVDLYRL